MLLLRHVIGCQPGTDITITLSFARTLSNPGIGTSSPNPSVASDLDKDKYNTRALLRASQVIDTQGPLRLHSTSTCWMV